MRYYIVSEEELERLSLAAWQGAMYWHDIATSRPGVDLLAVKEGAEAACRARPVPEWATHFSCDPTPYELVGSMEFEEIKK